MEGSSTLGLAFAAYEAELDGFLARLCDEPLPPPSRRALATEYRLLVNFGGRDGIEGIEARPLGVVTGDFAREQAEEVRRDHAMVVAVQRRDVLRGGWLPVGQIASGGWEELVA